MSPGFIAAIKDRKYGRIAKGWRNKMKAAVFFVISILGVTVVLPQARAESGFRFLNQMIPVPCSDWRVWFEHEPSNFGGDFYGENGSGAMSIHVRGYYDEQFKSIRYAGAIIEADDVAVEPKIIVFRDLEYSAKKGLIFNGDIVFRPVEFRASQAEWAKGMVYRDVLYVLKD